MNDLLNGINNMIGEADKLEKVDTGKLNPVKPQPQPTQPQPTITVQPNEWKFEQSKYPNVKKTPYGFIYNYNDSSITDNVGQKRAFGEKVDPNKKYGFTYTLDGDEVYADTFEDAIKGIDKNKK